MKHYPSLNYFGKHLGIPVIAFDKLDGSNLRFEWSKKRGFYKFGTKQTMIDEKTELFGEGVTIFLNKYADDLDKVFRSKDYRNILSFVCFAEFLGENSKFGQHLPNDKKDVVLFDVDQYKKGFVKPKQFINDFGHLHIPDVVYEGNLNKQLYQMVWDNKVLGYEGKLKEGVICKGVIEKGFTNLYYCKMKTEAWLDELFQLYGKEALEEELKNG